VIVLRALHYILTFFCIANVSAAKSTKNSVVLTAMLMLTIALAALAALPNPTAAFHAQKG
jgi:hypothetical protein